jgi:lauroyl/myristoyl acyltransferase
MLARVYEEIIYTMREHLPAGWHPEVDLRGGEYIEQARQRGRGVILWVCSSVPGDLVTWKSLNGAGFPVVLLRSFIHPYSATAFGRRVLNPVRRRVEDKYLHGTVTLVFGEEVRAVQELERHLRENDIIAITAVAASDQLLTVPFLGGVLRLALGAPTLAELNGAPLLPVFVVPKPNDAFEVVVGRPLQGELRDGENPSAEDLARMFIGLLEDYVTRHPTEWRGWNNKTQWGPE